MFCISASWLIPLENNNKDDDDDYGVVWEMLKDVGSCMEYVVSGTYSCT